MRTHPVLIAIAMVLATIVMLVLGATAISCQHIEKMAELGYQEEILPGSSMSYWRRCK